MACAKRKLSEADLYHVYARGTGRRLIFEDDVDRDQYCRRLCRVLGETQGSLYAWCLMGNHVHLVVKMEIEVLSSFMKRLNGGYARYFNARHERSGHLFESRFGSEPVTTDEQLMTVVRYVHRNPVKANMTDSCDYRWSSYKEYLSSSGISDTAFVLALFDGLDAFKGFHEIDGAERYLGEQDELSGGGQRDCRCVTADEAVELAKSLIGRRAFDSIAAFSKEERDRCLVALKDGGLSIRLISLVTGINRNTVWAAGRGQSV